jgi:hypothetical protein
MGVESGVISAKQAKALGPKGRARLKKMAAKLMRTDPQIRKMLKRKLAPTVKKLSPKGSR